MIDPHRLDFVPVMVAIRIKPRPVLSFHGKTCREQNYGEIDDKWHSFLHIQYHPSSCTGSRSAQESSAVCGNFVTLLSSFPEAAFVTKTAYRHYLPLRPPNKHSFGSFAFPMTQAERFWFEWTGCGALSCWAKRWMRLHVPIKARTHIGRVTLLEAWTLGKHIRLRISYILPAISVAAFSAAGVSV